MSFYCVQLFAITVKWGDFAKMLKNRYTCNARESKMLKQAVLYRTAGVKCGNEVVASCKSCM